MINFTNIPCVSSYLVKAIVLVGWWCSQLAEMLLKGVRQMDRMQAFCFNLTEWL